MLQGANWNKKTTELLKTNRKNIRHCVPQKLEQTNKTGSNTLAKLSTPKYMLLQATADIFSQVFIGNTDIIVFCTYNLRKTQDVCS